MINEKLPLARNSQSNSVILSQSALTKILEVAQNTFEPLSHFQTELIERVGHSPEFAEVLFELGYLVESVQYKEDNKPSPWSDETGLVEALRNYFTDTDPIAEFKAGRAAIVLTEANQGILMGYTFNDQGQFLRGYFSGDQELNSSELDAMNTMFNEWLIENKMLNDEGIIYSATEQGDIKTDTKGNKIKVDPGQFANLLNSESDKKGFKQYLKDKNISITIEQNIFQSPTAEPA